METLPVPARPDPSPYELAALQEINLWKEPAEGAFGAAYRKANQALRRVSGLVHRIPGVDWTVDNVLSGLLDLTNEIAQDSVRREAIVGAYRTAGFPIGAPADVRALDLIAVDERLRGLDAKYRSLALAEGAATGFAGLPGLLPDLFAIVALGLRAMGEYATYCGFDLTEPEERFFALQVLNAVSEPATAGRSAALQPVREIARSMARRTTAETVERIAKGRAIRYALRGLVLRLTRLKFGQVVPVAGAALGGGYNAYYISKACDAAFFVYRERFLAEKYGVDFVRWGA